MDHPLPPAPPAWRAVPSPVSPSGTCARAPFARGDTPTWTLTDCDGHLRLDIVGVAPIRLDGATWRATPAGRTLTATDPRGGTVSLRVAPGLCRDRVGRPATLAIGGRSLAGCLLGNAERPYDGGR